MDLEEYHKAEITMDLEEYHKVAITLDLEEYYDAAIEYRGILHFLLGKDM